MEIINRIKDNRTGRVYDLDNSKYHVVIIDALCHECKDFLPFGDNGGICRHYGETLTIPVSDDDFCSKGERNNKDDCPSERQEEQ